MIRLPCLAAAALAAGAIAAPPAAMPPGLVVSADGHMLATADGKPFFWLGDTAWELIHRTTPDEADFYLRTRARQGFTVIQTVVLAEQDGLRTPTPDGLLPFRDVDPAKPNPAYFDRVARIVEQAGKLGMYVALVPVWGDKLTAPWGDGPRIFTNANLPAARAYGRFLAERLRRYTNVIWVLGGDRPALLSFPGSSGFGDGPAKAGFAPDQDWTPIWAALADGLAAGGARLTIYHPQGGSLSSSVQLPHAGWLKINGMQSGHGGGHDLPVWNWVARDYAMAPAKPTMDLEPNYEDHPYNPWPEWKASTGYFRDYDVRKQVWRSVLAGAAGVTYGHHAVWGFVGQRYPVINHADMDWVTALHRPGGEEMRYLRDLLLSRPYFRRVPDPALIVGDAGSGGRHIVAARDRDGHYAFVYVPDNDRSFTVDLTRLHAASLHAWWYDPRSGQALPIGDVAAAGTHDFTTPPQGPDWVLVLDDAAAGFRRPGASEEE